MDTNLQPSSLPTEAVECPLPATYYYSVEYPGYVEHSSVPLAVRNLGGASKLESAFKRTAAKNETLLELNLRYGNPYAHPIPGDIVGTSNILIKVTKRKRRGANDGIIGDYIVQPLGVILKTARFRSESNHCYCAPCVHGQGSNCRLSISARDIRPCHTVEASDG